MTTSFIARLAKAANEIEKLLHLEVSSSLVQLSKLVVCAERSELPARHTKRSDHRAIQRIS
jgi:hypothetical protein